MSTPAAGSDRCRFIVLANEKGGSGKSTLAMHLAVALMRMGGRIASIDLDIHQGTLSHYIENRRRYAESQGISLKIPEHHAFKASTHDSVSARQAAEHEALMALAGGLRQRTDFIVIDTPGRADALARSALSLADYLVTPLNDSFLDLDVIVRIDIQNLRNLEVSTFCNAVVAERAARRQNGKPDFAWFVMRNRLSNIGSRNKQDIQELLLVLGQRFKFQVLDGFSERVIYRELFLRGLTVLDLREGKEPVGRMNMSHLKARQELRTLLDALGLAVDPARAGIAVGLSD